ncbi:methyl-accepting chemotaxis protein [Asticcacaulis sp.]|uniref:methyl-accepting chemotaxis protein n=1 Tax=Asticcacaulis sp. TaxID=1872648 RepID=UPI0026161A12|nr:methyl-accepting chemotaxis protein [Asticcacaulis sp.]
MFSRLSLQIKVISLVAFIAAIGAAVVLYTEFALGSAIDKYEQALTGPSAGAVALAGSARDAAWTSRSILNAIIAEDAGKFEKARRDTEDGRALFNSEMKAAERLLPEKAKELDVLVEKYNAAMSTVCLEAIGLSEANRKEDAVTQMENSCAPALLEVIKGIDVIVGDTVQENNVLASKLNKDSDVASNNSKIFGLVGLTVIGALAVWLVHMSARQKVVAEAARRAAMLKLADDFEKSVGGIVSLVSSAATEMQAAASQLSATAQQTSSQSVAVSSAAEEAEANVTSVAASTEELGASVEEISRQIETSACVTANAVREADAAQSVVGELNETATAIGGVVDLIAGLASQTNLLALNAAIESARAGEAGRGFAVVASEVKALAAQTAKATTEISEKIAKIQEATVRASTTMHNISGTIQSLNHSCAAIATAVEQQNGATKEIIQAINQVSVGTQEVTTNISGVAKASEQTGEAAVQVQSSSTELAMQAERLYNEMDKFLQTVRAA